ncbi:MAG: tyrosine--tRNA ligase [Bacteroidales bacterium]|nr:tyrosine--tRNA ligase [Bacteroidales bacterium]
MEETKTELLFAKIDEQVVLIKRGVAEFISEQELREKLKKSQETNKPLIIKLGVDPTAPDIHLGHTVVFRKLRHFQELGHSIKFLIGDFTGRIGDPSGRDATRPPLTEEQILENAKTYIEQVSKILDKDNLEVVFNSHWLKSMTFEDVIKMAAQTTMAKLMEHNTFRKRFESSESIRMHEFLYPFMQGYDSVALKADVELGGTDQTFNLTFGRELQKSFGQESQVCLTMPILVGTDGTQKMSKSLGNYIGIDEPAPVMFEKIMQMNDSNIIPYFTLLTDMPIDEIDKMKIELENSPTTEVILTAKKKLAFDIVHQFHGADIARKALNDYGKTDKEGMPVFSVNDLNLTNNSHINIIDMMLQLFDLKSRGECKRLLEPGAVKIDDQKVTETETLIFAEAGMIVKVGKNRIVKLQ